MSKSILEYSVADLEHLFVSYKQPKFRAKQVYEWLHKHRVTSYDQMTNIPKALRDLLEADFPLGKPAIVDRQVSSDGSRKYVLRYSDGSLVETVGLPSFDKNEQIKRLTVCFSTQVGCAMECAFCATGKEGFTRNLTALEMVDQINVVETDFDCRVTNVVAMGQGEPFLNYDELMKALRILNSPDSFNIGARHITISTCGIFSGIEKLSDEPEQFTLAISLHAATQDLRNGLMPRVSNQPLRQLKKVLGDYIRKTNRRVTFEYLLIKDINDQEEDLSALVSFCKNILCHVNLLPMNSIDGSDLQPSNQETCNHWLSVLEKNGIEATMRKSRGSDIAGACGQLKNKQAQ
ncbi:MAG: 23S rRNA (adenine(2503)-C(2))-methyltransferase RlmN [Eggerthellaceae bacterium]|nr:23S rRNA (adenine(2503)-C(2))-methyltransferase RlmN [Eggerthellaceae bacterium]